jgi:CBS domain-containing protein
MKIAEIMTAEVVTVLPEAPLHAVAETLVARGISGLPVCGHDGELLGVVSAGDIIWKETGLAARPESALARILNAADHDDDKLAALTAGGAMSAPAVTISPTASVASAARIMLEAHVNRLPVVSEGRLVGIVTRTDLVRAFVRSDEEIERELTDDVLLRVLWVDPSTLTIGVSQGQVTITGLVDNRSTAELIETYVRRIPGVVDATLELTWAIDDTARRIASAAATLPRSL